TWSPASCCKSDRAELRALESLYVSAYLSYQLPVASHLLPVPCPNWKRGTGNGLRFRSLRSVLRATLFSSLHAHRVERAADDVVADTREILHAAAANQDQRVLLQVVPDSGNVGGDLDPVRQSY